MHRVRACEASDYEAVARIHNIIRAEPTTAAEMLRSDKLGLSQEGVTLVRVVAEDERGEVVGYGFAESTPWMPEKMWFVKAMVEPGARGRSIGRALYDHVKEIAVKGGATALESWVEGGDEASYAWAERRGFTLDKQRTESVLDLTSFDMSRFAGVTEKVEASGLRLAATKLVDDALLRQIWELDCTTAPDVPIFDPNEKLPTFEEYQKVWRDDPAERVVAGCFDGDRLVGLSFLWLPEVEGGGAYTGLTAVYREYRGRSIALAVKLLSIREALAHGAPHMRTNNDPDNPPMLAVNAKLGYKLVPGPCRFRMTL